VGSPQVGCKPVLSPNDLASDPWRDRDDASAASVDGGTLRLRLNGGCPTWRAGAVLASTSPLSDEAAATERVLPGWRLGRAASARQSRQL